MIFKFRRINITWFRRFSRGQLIYFGGMVFVAVVIGVYAGVAVSNRRAAHSTVNQPKPETTSVQQPSEPKNKAPEPPKTPPPAAAPAPAPAPSLPFLFGVGTELDHAINHRITKEAPIKLLSSWYNGPNDLGFMNHWRTNDIPKAYAAGYDLHLIIYSGDAEQEVSTPYGAACGRPYPVSQQFLNDVTHLAQNFRGGKLYVSMFTEFQTYPCSDNNWVGSENYYKTLKDNYSAALKIFHEQAPGSQVSLSWGGWQMNWDDPGKGGGRSLFKHFADVMNASDFQSFQAMSNTDNLTIITNMTKALSPYSGGVMVAHYKPDASSQNTFDADMKNIFTPASIAALQQNGLFAFSFMDTNNMNSSEATYQMVKNIVQTHAR